MCGILERWRGLKHLLTDSKWFSGHSSFYDLSIGSKQKGPERLRERQSGPVREKWLSHQGELAPNLGDLLLRFTALLCCMFVG